MWFNIALVAFVLVLFYQMQEQEQRIKKLEKEHQVMLGLSPSGSDYPLQSSENQDWSKNPVIMFALVALIAGTIYYYYWNKEEEFPGVATWGERNGTMIAPRYL